MVSYLVVGLGISGWSFVRLLREKGESFIVVDDGKPGASHVSGGFYNPVILKRFTPAWKAHEFLAYALEQYKKAEKDYGRRLVYPLKIYRKLASVEEQNQWAVASQRPVLSHYMHNVVFDSIEGIEAPFGFGVLENTGMVDLQSLLQEERNRLKKEKRLIEENFEYSTLIIKDKEVEYKGIQAKHVVFAEGYGVKRNPFFNYLPLTGTKGELLEVELARSLDKIIKSGIFLAPIPWKNTSLAGATYEWKDKTNIPTAQAKEHLTKKLKKLYKLPFRFVQQYAGIRPTVIDRRPLIGSHPHEKTLFVLNGMGTRGVIYAPKIAEYLWRFIAHNDSLPLHINISRF